MCLPGPFPRLAKRIPTSSLFNPRIVVSIVFETIVNLGAIIAVYLYLTTKPW